MALVTDLELPNLASYALNIDEFKLLEFDDDEFITKTNGQLDYLKQWFESYNLAILQYGHFQLNYLEQARQVPIDIRDQLAEMLANAESIKQQMTNTLGAANLPPLPGAPGFVLTYSDDGTGYVSKSANAFSDGVVDQLKSQFVEMIRLHTGISALPYLPVGSLLRLEVNTDGVRYFMPISLNELSLEQEKSKTISATSDSVARVGQHIILSPGVVLTLPSIDLYVGATVSITPISGMIDNPATLIAPIIAGDNSGHYPFDIDVGITLVWVGTTNGWRIR